MSARVRFVNDKMILPTVRFLNDLTRVKARLLTYKNGPQRLSSPQLAWLLSTRTRGSYCFCLVFVTAVPILTRDGSGKGMIGFPYLDDS